MGPRILNNLAQGTIPASLNSILATPAFFKTPQFTCVLFKETVSGSDQYSIAQVRLLFSVPVTKSQAGAVAARLNPPVKYALVQLFDRVKPDVSSRQPEEEMRCGRSLLEWKPTPEEDAKPTACVQLRMLSSKGTVVIPLSTVVQTVMVLQDFSEGNTDRFLLNKWFWRTPS